MTMFEAPKTAFLVPYDGSFRVAAQNTRPPEDDRRHPKKRLRAAVRQLEALQRLLLANDSWSVLLVFQGMDASGKDSTIRAVMRRISPAGCQVFNFKRPTSTELDHDFLWRASTSLPERGRIGIFNRSQYEEVLVVRVHPEILERQQLPRGVNCPALWNERIESIRDQEKHLARNGTLILKFWLNVSRGEQKRRFLSRLDELHKHWKFNPDDLAERDCWDHYMQAYEDALNATSRPWAPWYSIPADSKPYMRAVVAETMVSALSSLALEYPQPGPAERECLDKARKRLG